jgi:hypothetical protein
MRNGKTENCSEALFGRRRSGGLIGCFSSFIGDYLITSNV